MSTALIEYDFRGHPVRVEDHDGEPWYVARDVGDALEMTQQALSKAVSRLDPKHRRLIQPLVVPLGGSQKMLLISEPGRYLLVMRSRMPAAEAFQEWIAEEVLVAIRKTGSYGAPMSMEHMQLAVHDHLVASVQRLELKAATAEQARQLAENKVEDARPALELRERIETSEGELSISSVCAQLRFKRAETFAWLRAEGHIFDRDKKIHASSAMIKSGRMVMRGGTYTENGRRHYTVQLKVTTKGITWFVANAPARLRHNPPGQGALDFGAAASPPPP